MEIRNRPWTDLAKFIRVVESCETREQLESMANKMWGLYTNKYGWLIVGWNTAVEVYYKKTKPIQGMGRWT